MIPGLSNKVKQNCFSRSEIAGHSYFSEILFSNIAR